MLDVDKRQGIYLKSSDFVYLRDSALLENSVVNFTGPIVVFLKEKTIKCLQ